MWLRRLFDPVLKHQHACHCFLEKGCPAELKKYYEKNLPLSSAKVKDHKIVSIDFETTGIDPANDYILSIGGIEIIDLTIDFSTSFHDYVNNSAHIKEDSAIINQITPEILSNGKEPYQGIIELLDRLAGTIVLTHCKFIEMNFIKEALNLKKNAPLPFLIFDTMGLERSLHRNENNLDVTLSTIRQRRGLPEYTAHNALVDSLATAEVFLTQVKDIFGDTEATVLELYRRS